MTTVVWFRQDLRTSDNPALAAAAARGPVIPIFILDDSEASLRPGGAGRWWLHHSISALQVRLKALHLFRGAPRDILPAVIKAANATGVYWNRCYEPAAVARDKGLMAALRALSIEVRTFNSSLLHEPWDIASGSGGPFKVFTPFWRAAVAKPVAEPLPAPRLQLARSLVGGDRLEAWALHPSNPNWAKGWEKVWAPGEPSALASFEHFIRHGLKHYHERRDRPDLDGTSRLSPHLHWGEISSRQIWARLALVAEDPAERAGADKFLTELGWREFAYHLLYHFPTLPENNWRREFDDYPWRNSPDDLRVWQRGLTGYPIVDAGMRQLWRTGWMHNRVRMITASFLTKHLRVDWRQGAAWFRDTLVDADLANNSAGWQWVAGSGADAAPYFRIFNPVIQGKKFDPSGEYVRRWCPELARVPNEFVHEPFSAPPHILAQARVELGRSYPAPIVDHGLARRAALDGYAQVTGQTDASLVAE